MCMIQAYPADSPPFALNDADMAVQADTACIFCVLHRIWINPKMGLGILCVLLSVLFFHFIHLYNPMVWIIPKLDLPFNAFQNLILIDLLSGSLRKGAPAFAEPLGVEATGRGSRFGLAKSLGFGNRDMRHGLGLQVLNFSCSMFINLDADEYSVCLRRAQHTDVSFTPELSWPSLEGNPKIRS